jgi:hypothetical protein
MKIHIPKRKYNATVSLNAQDNKAHKETHAQRNSITPFINSETGLNGQLRSPINFIQFKDINRRNINSDQDNGIVMKKKGEEEKGVRELCYTSNITHPLPKLILSRENLKKVEFLTQRSKKIHKQEEKANRDSIKDKRLTTKLKSLNTDSIEAIPRDKTEKIKFDYIGFNLEQKLRSVKVSKPDTIGIVKKEKTKNLKEGPKCSCKKTFCLRLHCACFNSLNGCSILCGCVNCKNNVENDKERQYVIMKTKEINPLAFKPKIKSMGETTVNARGCRCTKNGCIKQYCECYKNGSGCSELCRCLNCKNTRIEGGSELLKLREKGYRKKHRIVISNIEGEDSGIGIQFIKHKKKRKSRRTNQ